MATETTIDPELLLASIMDGHERMLTAGRKTTLELMEAYVRTLNTFADSQEKLAEASQFDWQKRALRARAAYTRELAGASERYVREVTET